MDTDTHILVVDDEPPNRLILEDLLAQHYSVCSVNNGRQALDYLLQGGRADLILLDVVMPEMDGFEACRKIRAEPRLQDIPVLFLTSLESVSDEEHGLSLGAADFIHKPFSRVIVLARVRNHLELAIARRRLRDRNVELELLVAERTRELLHEKEQVIAVQDVTITALCILAEMRDNETGN
jgi:putative two-component system response regulator